MDTQKIIPCFWFEDQAEAAVNFYTSVFPDSKILTLERYSKTMAEAAEQPEGTVLSLSFELAGQSFFALNGGPVFHFTPAFSFFYNASSREEVDALWHKLLPGSEVLMDLDTYPFSERYGWLQDQFGVSWQLILSPMQPTAKIEPCLMFIGDQLGKARQAMALYTSLFADSGVVDQELYEAGEESPEGTVKFARFKLAGQSFTAMENGGDHGFTFTPAISLMVSCADQGEIDCLWDSLSRDGTLMQCGWLSDTYGVTWQIVPEMLDRLMRDEDPVKADRVAQAMLKMVKLDIAELQRAYDGK